MLTISFRLRLNNKLLLTIILIYSKTKSTYTNYELQLIRIDLSVGNTNILRQNIYVLIIFCIHREEFFFNVYQFQTNKLNDNKNIRSRNSEVHK